MEKHITQELNYSDIYLLPRKILVDSRKNCDTSVKLGERVFDLPIYAANMKSVVNENTCEFFAAKNLFYTMHRFNTDNIAFIKKMHSKNYFASISIGINNTVFDQLGQMLDLGLIPEYITVDIANAWSVNAKPIIEYVKKHFKSFLIVGNVATRDAVEEIHSWGADAVKVGIAGGRVCITKDKTGFHRPMVSTVLDCADYCSRVGLPLIADGGIINHGDIAKAMACGATMVMAGSLFAGYDESAGNIIEITLEDNTRLYKEYYGSASQYNKEEYKNIEGKKILVPYRGSMVKLLRELFEDIQSAISYSGGMNCQSLRNVDIISVGHHG